MNPNEAYLGIDISTTAAKALLLDAAGRLIASASVAQELSQPQPGWSEQHPETWWNGVVGAIRKALQEGRVAGEQVCAIGLTGQMHGLVLLDERGKVLRPAILWNDQRTAEQCEEMKRRIGAERLLQLSGNPALTGFTAPKILWVRQHEPEIYDQIAQVLLPKDYIRYRLSGEFATDLAGASGTSLLHVAARNWSEEICAALALPLSWLPPVHEGSEITGAVQAAAAAATGLRAGTPIVAGGGDQAAGAIGMGCVSPGTTGVTLGTSGVVFSPLAQYDAAAVSALAGRLHTFCHAAPGRWHYMGVMLSAAGSLRWYRDRLAPEVPYPALLAEAAQVPAGCEGLFFLPYLSGERTPHPDPSARGAFIGLATHHRRGHLTRAVLEGVAFGLRDCLALLEGAGTASLLGELRISGGGARSPIWQQIVADILGQPLVNVNQAEAGAFGAALLAAVGVGRFPSVSAACDDWVTLGSSIQPGEDASRYAEIHPRYRELYPRLQDWFAGVPLNSPTA
ncbi:MAG: xylulokinase [Anaerolineaceae bacterium]|nr:xylulokinase [Anaerolineaceae bacterium]